MRNDWIILDLSPSTRAEGRVVEGWLAARRAVCEEVGMTCCQQCSAWVFEHTTSDERIVYCQRCGWEFRESLRSRSSQAAPPRRAAAPAPVRPQRRHG